MAHSFLYEVQKISELNNEEIKRGIFNPKHSWHQEFKHSAYIRIDGLHHQLSEGDVICVFSQFGEIADCRLIRDKETGKSRGFCFVCYENQQSTVYAVDNMNGFQLAGKTMKVNHVNFKVPILLDQTKFDADGNPIQIAYKPTGAEGHGVGIYNVTSTEKSARDHEKNIEDDRRKRGAVVENRKAIGVGDDDADLAAFEQGLQMGTSSTTAKTSFIKEARRAAKKKEKKDKKKEKKRIRKEEKKKKRKRKNSSSASDSSDDSDSSSHEASLNEPRRPRRTRSRSRDRRPSPPRRSSRDPGRKRLI